jgi:hypothetical protein
MNDRARQTSSPLPPPRNPLALPHLDGLPADKLKKICHDQHRQILELLNRNGASGSVKNAGKNLPELIDAAEFLPRRLMRRQN